MVKTPVKATLRSISTVGESTLSSIDSLAVIRDFFALCRTVQEEQTKRAHIAARREVLLEAISSERRIILDYFDRRFAERKSALDRLFLVLDEGVSSKDVSMIDSSITGILGVLQDNPLEDLAEFKRNMARDDFTLEL